MQDRFAESLDGVEFLGIDAVSVALQSPPLPEGSPSAMTEYLDLTADPFTPSAYLRDRVELDPVLRSRGIPRTRGRSTEARSAKV